MATRNTYIIAVIVAIIVIVAVSAFVLSGTPAPSGGTTTTTTGTTTTTTTTTAATIRITADNIKFNGTNPTITVKADQPVTFVVVNEENIPHNFIIEGVAGGSTTLLNAGQTEEVTVTLKAGTYKYYCSIHPGQMDGQIIAK